MHVSVLSGHVPFSLTLIPPGRYVSLWSNQIVN